MTKMGKYNKITSEQFHAIKGALAEGESDECVMRRHQIKATTLRYIKMSLTYYEYYLRTEGIPAARKMPEVELPNCRLKLIDYSSRRPKKKRTDGQKSSEPISAQDEDRVYTAICGFMIGGMIVLLGAMIVGCILIINLITGN